MACGVIRAASAACLRVALAAALVALVALVALLPGCNPESPPAGPEATCVKACSAHATQCSRHECARGCNLILDRLTEGEGGRVIDCVAGVAKACTDRTWAHCAVRIGIHVDGGPPAPLPPSDQEEEDL
jgi:hypothetical protein